MAGIISNCRHAFVFATVAACGSGNYPKEEVPPSPTPKPDGGTTIESAEHSTVIMGEGENLSGMSVTIAPGALAVGSTVVVKDATTAPVEGLAVVEASAPVDIAAFDTDGKPITEANQAFVVTIPLDQVTPASLSLAEEEQDLSSLCALATGYDGQNYVWRRKSLAIAADSASVTFESVKFGVYQLAYCADDELANFLDAETAGVSGSLKRLVHLGVERDFIATPGTNVCLSLSDGQMQLVAATQGSLQADTDLRLALVADVGEIKASDSYQAFVALLSGECDFTQPRPLGDAIIASYGPWLLNGEALVTSGVTATLGAPGAFDLVDIRVQVLTEAAASTDFQRPSATTMCLAIANDTGGTTFQSAVLDGTQTGNASGATFYAQEGTTYTVTAYATSSCTPDATASALRAWRATPNSDTIVELNALGLLVYSEASSPACSIVRGGTDGSELGRYDMTGIGSRSMFAYVAANVAGGYAVDLDEGHACSASSGTGAQTLQIGSGQVAAFSF